jgi:Tfp pilus assembly protein PilN
MRAVNLIPAEERGGQSVAVGRSQGVAYAVVVLTAGLALMAYLYGGADHRIKSQKAQIASLAKQTQEVQQSAERLAPYASFLGQREARQQAVETVIDSRFDWAHAFHEFGRVLPADVSISSLSGTVGSSTSTSSSAAASGAGSATPPGTVPTFSLTGCATSQPVVAQTLQRLRLIDGVSDVSLLSSAASGSAGSSSSSSGGACPAGGPTFSVTIAFDPLPSAADVASAAKIVSDTGSASSAKGGSAR